MKRIAARLGLVALAAGTPAALASTVGGPQVPSFTGVRLSDTYLPLDPALQALGLLAWALWGYLAIVIVLRTAVAIAVSRGVPAKRLDALSSGLTPGAIRRVIDVAFGGALLAVSIAGTVDIVTPAPVHAVAVTAATTGQSEPDREDASRARPAVVTYRVQDGDSLWRIAEHELGSGHRWRDIFELNRGRRFPDGGRMTHPRLIYPGWTLELPQRHQRSVAAETNATATKRMEVPKLQLSRGGSPAHNGQLRKADIERPTATPESHDDKLQPSSRPVLRLSSGLLVAASFASGLLAADLLTRLRIRRARRLDGPIEEPAPASDPRLLLDLRSTGSSPSLGPLETGIEAVAEAWRSSSGSWPHILAVLEQDRRLIIDIEDEGSDVPKECGGTVSPHVRFSRTEGIVRAEVTGPFPTRLRRVATPLQQGILLPLGEDKDGSAFYIACSSLGSISLLGDQRWGVARHGLLTMAASSEPDDLQFVLLGTEAGLGIDERLPHVQTVCGWDKAPDVLRKLQEQLLWRARLFFEEGVQDIGEHLAHHSDEMLPALLLVCADPPLALRGLVEATGQQLRALGGALVAIGWTAAGTRLTATADDSLRVESDFPPPGRLRPFALDDQAAAQAIEVIQRAHPKEDEAEEEDLTELELPGESILPEPVTLPEPPASEQRIVIEERAPLSVPPLTIEIPQPPSGIPAVRCLGRLEISRDDRVFRKRWRTRAKEFIAYLIAHPDGVPKDRIMEELWTDADPRSASADVDRIASAIRSRVRVLDDPRGKYIENVNEFVKLERSVWWVDAWEMEGLINDAERSVDSERAIGKFRAALALYRGEFCDDAYYSWAEPIRERHRAIFTRASAHLAELLERSNDVDGALAVLDRAVEVDPVCEELQRRAMKIEVQAGRRSAALRRYDALKRILWERLETEPDGETQALMISLRKVPSVQSVG